MMPSDPKTPTIFYDVAEGKFKINLSDGTILAEDEIKNAQLKLHKIVAILGNWELYDNIYKFRKDLEAAAGMGKIN